MLKIKDKMYALFNVRAFIEGMRELVISIVTPDHGRVQLQIFS